jgi:cyclophilin family peptidyl-prolyl cis-trans isomerase/HEAT repeat protein
MLARSLLLGLAVLAANAPGSLAVQSRTPATVDTAALQRLLVAEDARGTGPDGLAPLLEALGGGDTLLRRLAVRGLGRFQRPELGRVLLPLLTDPVPAIRGEAANAIAQSLRRTKRSEPAPDSARLGTREAAAQLAHVLAAERSPAVAGALAQSLGRLPLPDSAAARTAEAAICARLAARPSPGLTHGIYTLARARRATGNLTDTTVRVLRRTAASPDTTVRRLALLTLAVAGGLDSATAVHAARDRDDETRRMALRGAGALSPSLRARLIARALTDPSAIVRTEVAAAARLGDGPPDCAPLLSLTRDRDPYVVLAAIDSLAGSCADTAAAARTLRGLAQVRPGTETQDPPPAGGARSSAGPSDHRWQAGAHALLALARLDPGAAARLLSRFGDADRPEVRAYAARAAAVLGATPLLYALAHDPNRNVQEAAIIGLAATVRHEADSVYLDALGSSGHQVALAAADALDSTSDPAALDALLAAFDRLSATRSENARDPRMSMLARIGALGSRPAASRLEPYLADYDTAVAALAAETVSRWTGTRVEAHPAPLPIHPEPLAETLLRDDVRLRVTMAPSSGGGTFTVLLFPREAPATVARVLRLVRQGWYDGKAFQRVEPNFVIQGGGPDANEYVGDDTFMRDELTLRTHARGTFGISARGRDTGDGQWFINLVDNPLLDHEYTIFGRIESGRSVAERILEGDRIGRVELVGRADGRTGGRTVGR